MKAWRFYGFGDLRLDEVPLPALRPRHVLAQVDAALVLQKGHAVLQGPAADVAANVALGSYLGV